MIGKSSNSQIRTVALGATVNSSVYGQTIPLIYGVAKSAAYLIWAANLRMGASGKGAKKEALLGPLAKILGVGQGYLENVDFLVGHNPIIGALQFWVNQQQWLPLNFQKYTVSTHFTGAGNVTIGIPDSLFYSVMGVTITMPYGTNIPTFNGTLGTVVFNDYGGQGPQTYTGDYEVPLWNLIFTGPNPTDPSGARYWPYVYQWLPGDDLIVMPGPLFGTFDVNIYYAQLDPGGASLYNKKSSGTAVPIAALNMVFENVLGDGNEYALPPGNPAEGQQIKYPHYAGMGSVALDLGTSNNLPNLQPEIQGSFSLYSTGDADFADMIEDIFNGSTQAGIANTTPITPLQHGLNCQNFPGCIQNVSVNGDPIFLGGSPLVFQYPLPNTAGNFLVAAFACANGVISGITDTAGNTWTPRFSSPAGEYQVWTAVANAYSTGGKGTTVSIAYTWSGLPTLQGQLLEVAGVDTLNAVASTTAGGSLSITSTGASGNPAYLLAFGLGYGQGISEAGNAPPTIPNWTLVSGEEAVSQWYLFYGRTVYYPGTFTITFPTLPPYAYAVTSTLLLCFTNSEPVNYPKALGDILDHASLDLVRQQCRASGLYGSFTVDSQDSASKILGDLYDAADAAPVWSGFKLKSIPWSEVSAVGNGAIYNAPTASGPVVNLTEASFIADPGQPPVTVVRKAQLSIPDLLQIQQPSRAAQYNDVVVSQPETAAIALYGARKADPKQMRMFQDPAVGRMFLGILARRQNYQRRTYQFKLKANYKLLEAMDLATIPLSATMPNPGFNVPTTLLLPVRLTSVKEDAKFNLDCEAQDFIYGTNAPSLLPVTAQSPNFPQTGATPANVAPPIIFEPVPRLEGTNTGEVWVVVPNSDSNFGGTQVFLSTDGGNSYTNQGSTIGAGTTGYLTAEWPSAEDPDTTHNLEVDLTESNGALSSFSTEDEDNFIPLCYVGGTATPGIRVQKAGTSGHNVTSVFKAFTSDNAAGNGIVVAVGVYNGAGYDPPRISITDSQNNIYTVAATTNPTIGSGVCYQLWIFTAFGIAAGANTVTVHSSSSADLDMAIHEYFNVNGVDSFMAYSTGTAPAGIASGSCPVKYNGDLLFSCMYDGQGDSSEVITIGSQFASAENIVNSSGRGVLQTCDGPAGAQYQALFTMTNQGGNIHAATISLYRVNAIPQPGVVQSTGNIVQDALGVSDCTATFDRSITAGNAIALCVTIHGNADLNVNILDTLGNIYTQIGDSGTFSGDGKLKSYFFLAFGSAGGANTITATPVDNVDTDVLSIEAQEVYGVTAAVGTIVDDFAGNTLPDGSNPYPLSINVALSKSQLGDVILAYGFVMNGDVDGQTSSPYYAPIQTDTYGGVPDNSQNGVTFLQSGGVPANPDITVNFGGSGTNTRGATAIMVALHNANTPLQDNYELMSYAVADMTSVYNYTLEATGGNHLRRAVYGAPQPNLGDDHPVGARFAYIGQGASGLIKLNFDSNLTHATINLKFPAFNSFLGGLQSQADIPAYGYTFSGLSQQNNPNTYNYSVTPADCLSNPNATTIDIAQTTVQFPSNAVNYNARALTITAPSVPTQYFVTIYDPGYLGDPDSTTDLTAQASTDQSLIGTFGYTYMGSIICLPGGGGTTVTPGGLPLELGGSSANFVEEIPTGTLNGVNKIFTLSFTPNPTGSLFLFLNGVLQVISVDYTVTGSTITFTAAPVSDDDMIAQYTH